MSRYRIETQAAALTEALGNFRRLLPLAVRHLVEEYSYLDGFASQTPGHGVDETGVRRAPTLGGWCREVEGWVMEDGSTSQQVCGKRRPCPDHDTDIEWTVVDRAALARAGIESTLRQIADDVTGIASLIASATIVANAALGQRAPRFDVPECSRGVGREGAIEWQRPWCRNVPDETKAGMCDECWAAEAAWRDEHGLEPRQRTARQTPPPPSCVRSACERPATPGRSDGLCDAHRMADSRARRKAEEDEQADRLVALARAAHPEVSWSCTMRPGMAEIGEPRTVLTLQGSKPIPGRPGMLSNAHASVFPGVVRHTGPDAFEHLFAEVVRAIDSYIAWELRS